MSDFIEIGPQHNPNEGRSFINYNFSLIALSGGTANTATTVIITGGTNINVVSGGTGPILYTTSLLDNISLNTISGNSISATTFYSGSTNLSNLFSSSGISALVTFTNSGTTPTTIGGITAGSTFNNKTMQQMWDSLLYPYQVPAFTSFARANLSSTYELGEVVAVGSQTFTWVTSNSSNVSANTISIAQLVTPASTIYGPDSNIGSSAITVSGVYSAGTSTSTSLYTISGYNSQGNLFSSTISRNWRPRIYYGTDVTTPLLEANVKALANSTLAASFAGTYAFVAGGYKYFCYPTTLGTATTFKDSSNNLDVSMEALYTVSITNIYGVVLTYNIHRTTNILGSSINIIIS